MPKKKVAPPQSYAKWKHHTGPIIIQYIADADKRRKSRNDRRRTLWTKSHELAVICGGQIFVQFTDDNGQVMVYASNEQLYKTYKEKGIREDKDEIRLDENSKQVTAVVDRTLSVQSPTKSCRYNASFATDALDQINLNDTPAPGIAIWDRITSTPRGTRVTEHSPKDLFSEHSGIHADVLLQEELECTGFVPLNHTENESPQTANLGINCPMDPCTSEKLDSHTPALQQSCSNTQSYALRQPQTHTSQLAQSQTWHSHVTAMPQLCMTQLAQDYDTHVLQSPVTQSYMAELTQIDNLPLPQQYSVQQSQANQYSQKLGSSSVIQYQSGVPVQQRFCSSMTHSSPSVQQDVGSVIQHQSSPSVQQDVGSVIQHQSSPSVQQDVGSVIQYQSSPSVQQDVGSVIQHQSSQSVQQDVGSVIQHQSSPSVQQDAGSVIQHQSSPSVQQDAGSTTTKDQKKQHKMPRRPLEAVHNKSDHDGKSKENGPKASTKGTNVSSFYSKENRRPLKRKTIPAYLPSPPKQRKTRTSGQRSEKYKSLMASMVKIRKAKT